eukprot:CAMPEP_0119111438 /NCGR_PEP_ID=MMETSP1180-20130426/35616_1 /TAXON_ID=3052 ORGANISM="Chlamydomonas cf sp, Strain CCMP681" /NCGR_SAMPLE_ID=MMETSP1180 /ASSEMBLY_ACC=CAM_ASM_000741 /LENGTH=76 /DNA_ID=CAMNT_0007098409 /DNA_START=546 /DNA_END=777 /DNA_ORIENTATION=-
MGREMEPTGAPSRASISSASGDKGPHPAPLLVHAHAPPQTAMPHEAPGTEGGQGGAPYTVRQGVTGPLTALDMPPP